jgi:hypothetical protein
MDGAEPSKAPPLRYQFVTVTKPGDRWNKNEHIVRSHAMRLVRRTQRLQKLAKQDKMGRCSVKRPDERCVCEHRLICKILTYVSINSLLGPKEAEEEVQISGKGMTRCQEVKTGLTGCEKCKMRRIKASISPLSDPAFPLSK